MEPSVNGQEFSLPSSSVWIPTQRDRQQPGHLHRQLVAAVWNLNSAMADFIFTSFLSTEVAFIILLGARTSPLCCSHPTWTSPSVSLLLL